MSYLIRIDSSGYAFVIDWSIDPSEFARRAYDLNAGAPDGVEYLVEEKE